MAVAVAADLRVCGLLASAYALLGGEHVALARNVLRDLTARLRAEVDFRNETRNAQRLVAKLAVPGVSVPATVHELSGKRVLTMEWVDGVRISDVAGLHARGIDTKAAGARLLAAFADMLYVHGDLHGDLHPGNILVRGGGDAFEIVLLDHGWYVPLADALRKQYCRLWCAFVLRDSATAQAVAAEIAGPKGSAIVPAVLSLGASQRGATARDGGAAASTSGGGGLSLGGLESLSAISHFPSEVVEILRGSQAARNIGAALGCLASDRLAINARAALAGLSVATSSDGRVRPARFASTSAVPRAVPPCSGHCIAICNGDLTRAEVLFSGEVLELERRVVAGVAAVVAARGANTAAACAALVQERKGLPRGLLVRAVSLGRRDRSRQAVSGAAWESANGLQRPRARGAGCNGLPLAETFGRLRSTYVPAAGFEARMAVCRPTSSIATFLCGWPGASKLSHPYTPSNAGPGLVTSQLRPPDASPCMRTKRCPGADCSVTGALQ